MLSDGFPPHWLLLCPLSLQTWQTFSTFNLQHIVQSIMAAATSTHSSIVTDRCPQPYTTLATPQHCLALCVWATIDSLQGNVQSLGSIVNLVTCTHTNTQRFRHCMWYLEVKHFVRVSRQLVLVGFSLWEDSTCGQCSPACSSLYNCGWICTPRAAPLPAAHSMAEGPCAHCQVKEGPRR